MSKTRIKAFIISFIAAFLMVLLPKLGVRATFLNQIWCSVFAPVKCQASLINPAAKSLAIDKLRPYLQSNVKTFRLKKRLDLIPQALASSEYEKASAYGVIDLETGDVISQKRLSDKLPIASLTKIMTAVVALDLTSPDEEFSVDFDESQIIPTRFAFNRGDKLTLKELLNGMLLTSANDCAQIIKDGFDTKYGNGTFIAAMNEKAILLGLKNSHFNNPQGFDDSSHFSSVEDLTLLTRFALNHYPIISEIVQKDHEIALQTSGHAEFYMNNWNGLIGVYPGAYGVKIGNTGDAGYTTVVAAKREGKTLLAVVLGAPGILERDMWAAELLDTGFSTYGISPAKVTEAEFRAKYQTFKYSN